MVAGPVGFLVLFLLTCCLFLLSPFRYKLSEKGVSFETHLWKWDQLSGYRLGQEPDTGGLHSVTVYRNNGARRSLFLPGTELDQEILSAIAQRLRYLFYEPPQRTRPGPLSAAAFAFLYTASSAYAVPLGYATSVRGERLLVWAMLCGTLVLGPGTLGCLVLFRRRFFRRRDTFTLVVAFNLLGVALTALYFVVFALRRLQAL